MFFDEFHFHRKRGLGRWEAIGHPVDTLFFLACFIQALIFEPSTENVPVFLFLSAASCLIITKDEWVHAKECDPLEQWLHALLFVLHPLALLVLYQAWTRGHTNLILIHSIFIGFFFLYQAIYWNRPKRNLHETASK